ncbi:MAG: DNA recombination protein RmuC [Clostridia bacterium]|nr:DNA recombination protein RmuC [Clostridia bacterium]
MIETILLVATLILLGFLIVLNVVLIKRKNQGKDLDGVGLLNAIKQENEKTVMQLKLDNEAVLKMIRESNSSLMQYLKQYNETIVNGLGETYKMQRGLLKDVESRINDVLKSNDTRLERMKESLQVNMEKLQASNEKKLEEMRLVVDEKLQSTLEKRINTSFTQVSERLEQVYKGLGEMKTLAGDVGDLKKVLSNVKTRGTWGEVQLGNLLEQMLSQEQFRAQVMLDKNSTERVDFVVIMPGKDDKEVLLPIDAKYPIESYQRLVENSENNNIAGIETNEKELERTIKAYAKDISSKYIKVPTTTDFAIMYLPIEGLYAEVIKNTDLVQTLQRDFRIMVCGPTTLAALLNSLQMGFRTLAIEKRSSEVWALLSLFKTEFTKFYDLLLKTQKKLTEASNTIDDATRKTRTIERKLRSVDSLSPDKSNTLSIDFDDNLE